MIADEVPHGTPGRHKRGCRCDDCVAAWRRDREFRGIGRPEAPSSASARRGYARSHAVTEATAPRGDIERLVLRLEREDL